MRKKYLLLTLIFFVAVGLNGTASAEETAQTDKWEFDAAIYLWGASIGGNTGTGSDVDISFDDYSATSKWHSWAWPRRARASGF